MHRLKKKSKRHLIQLLMAFSFAIMGCSTIERPNTDVCLVNAPGATRKCYNLSTDYNDDGTLKPNAHAVYKPTVNISDINKNTCIDPDGLANLKAYIQKLRIAYQQQCSSGVSTIEQE